MKNTQTIVSRILVGLSLALTVIGCGKKSNAPSLDIKFSNNTASVLSQELQAVGPRGLLQGISLQSNFLQGVTPTIYQMKLVAMYLVEIIDENMNNAGDMTRIWTSSKCDDDLTHCGIGPAAGQYVVDYFDFAEGTAAVNARLASYKRETKESTLNPGTYNYIRIDFAGATGSLDSEVPNLKFGTEEAHEVRAQVQAINVALPEPLVLGEGETFEVDLAYDLENRFYSAGNSSAAPLEVSQSQMWSCAEQGASVPCIVEAEFSPTVTKK